MRAKLIIYEVLGFIITAIVGTLLHFTYGWSNTNVIVGLFSPINESTWEHLKLLYVPFASYSLLEYFILGRRFNNFLYYKAMSTLLGLSLIIGGFYLYSGIIGRSFLIIDISLFYFSVFITSRTSYRMIRYNPTYQNYNFIGGMILFTLSLLFIVFTFLPPPINLFLSPVSFYFSLS